MKDIIISPEHKKAAAIFLAIFALTAMFFFSSCQIQRDCPGAGVKNGYSGYVSKPAHPIAGPKRQSY
jgi:hypothetical protein